MATSEYLSPQGAVCIIEDAPAGMEFGFDLNCWRLAERFRGITMIPPGFHCIYYSANGAARQGCLVYTRDREILFMKYTTATETLEKYTPSSAVIASHLSNVSNRNLAAYPYDETYTRWTLLTDRLTEEQIAELTGCSDVCVSSDRLAELEWTRFDVRQSFPERAEPATITKYSIDKSYLMESLMSRTSEDRVLAEFQLGFVLFALLQTIEGLDVWKRWITVFLNCDETVVKHERFFDMFLTRLDRQIRECPSEFFCEFFDSQAFLPILLKRWWSSVCLCHPEPRGRLVARTRELLDYIASKTDFRLSETGVSDDEAVLLEEIGQDESPKVSSVESESSPE